MDPTSLLPIDANHMESKACHGTSIEGGAELGQISRSVAMHTATEIGRCRNDGRPKSEDIGCIAEHGPDFEPHLGFEELVIEGAVMLVFWSANEAFLKGGKIRDVPKEDYSEEADVSIHNWRHWRHCLAIGVAMASCWSLNPRFDETTEKYNNSLHCRVVSRVDPTKVRQHALRQF